MAEESLGVRSMALFVETRDVSILFDPGLSLSPRRFGLPPHPRELERARELRTRILEYASRAAVVTISHYHRDHFTPWYKSAYMATDDETYEAIYGGKLVLAKSPEGVNWSQRRRHYGLKKALEPVAALEYADGRTFAFGGTSLAVSPPLPHGPEGSRTGFVIAFLVAEGDERLLYMPDVQGPANEAALQFALSAKPTIAVVGGPPLYLQRNYPMEAVELGVRNLVRLIESPGLDTLVIAHHSLRDLDWRGGLAEVFKRASERGVRASTYAELLGAREELLEAMRRRLYEIEPPDSWAEEGAEGGEE